MILFVTNMIKFSLSKNAVLPTKAHSTDSGYDLTAITLEKTYGPVLLLDTGVSVSPPQGYYFDLVGRSSLMKKGYFVANCVGVIDESYTGNIKIPLVALPGAEPTLELPLKGFQLILRKRHDFPSTQVDSLDETERGSGGFGSTDIKTILQNSHC